MVRLKYHGHSCWELTCGNYRILIDPFLSGNPLADVRPESFQTLDAILVSHGHADHIGDTLSLANNTGALIISNFEIANHFASQGCRTHPMHIGGGHEFDFGHVRLTIAHHASSGPNGEPLGNPAGLIITCEGKTIYHAGDTAVFLDMQLIAQMYGPIDVALLPIGDNFTMGIAEALKAVELLTPKVAIPMHYQTFPVIATNPEDFIKQVNSRGYRALWVKPGETYECP